MSREDLPAERYALYRRGQLPPAEMLAVSDLLAAHPEWRAELAAKFGAADGGTHAGLMAELRAEAADPLPTAAELVAFLDGRLTADEHADFEARVAASPELAADVAALRQYRDEWKQNPAPRAEIAAATVGIRWRQLWRMAAGAAALLAIGFLVVANRGEEKSGAQSPELRAFLTEAERRSDLEDVLPLDLRRPAAAGTLMSNSAPPPSPGPRALSPLRTATDARPVFRWAAAEGATGYRVFVQPMGSTALIESPLLPAETRAWRSETPLPAGGATWEVVAYRGDETLGKSPTVAQPPARLRVLTSAEARQQAAWEREVGDDSLQRAFVLTRFGRREEALAELARAKARGKDAAKVEALAASLR